MNYTFDWPNKIITPTDAPISGAITIDVQDMYSRWVDWMVSSDNAKYLQAMRVVWWDPLPGSKQLWITYFLLNGWKIRPYESNHVFALDGNIYSEDWSSPFVPTVWAFNVTIINSVSNLVDSTVQQLPEIEYASFNWRITLDVNNWVAWTSYPIGTPTNPVNNLSDAKIIAAYRWFQHIDILSDLTIETWENIDKLHFTSDDWKVITIEPWVSSLNTNFERVSLYWNMWWIWNVLIDCWVYNITNFSWWMRSWSFENISLSVWTPWFEFGWQSFFDDIVPLYPWSYSNLVCNANTSIAFSNYTWLLDIKNVTTWCVVAVWFNTGKITLDNSNTGWVIKVRWVSEMVNNTAWTTVDDDTLNTIWISDSVWTRTTRTLTSWWGWSWWLSAEEHDKLMSTVTFRDLIIANQL